MRFYVVNTFVLSKKKLEVPPAPSDAGVPQSPMVEPSASSLGANTVGTNLSRPPASGGLKSDEFVEVLRSMKNEFANLGEKVAASPAPTARTMRTNFIDSTPRPATALNSDADPMSIRKNLDAELEEKDPKIAALEKQRSELLSTGLYNMNDKLIQAYVPYSSTEAEMVLQNLLW